MGEKSVEPLARISDVFFTVDTDWKLTYCNQSATRLFRRSNETLHGRLLWDVLPPEFDDRFSSALFEAMQSRTTTSADCYGPSGDNWYEARAYPTENGLTVCLLDANERKARESEFAQQAAVIEALDDGVLTLNERYTIVSINETASRVLGVSESEIIGEHVDTVTRRAEVPAEDVVSIGRAIDEVGTGKAASRTLNVSYTADGSNERIGELRIAAIDSERARLALVFRDVTKQRDYERLVHSLHEITRWLLESSDPEEICAIAVHAGSDLLELPISGIWMLDQEHGYLDPIAGTAGAHEQFGGLPRFRPGEGLVWDVYEDGSPVLYDDLSEEDGLYNPDTPLRSEIICPIGAYGILMTGSFERHRFDETDLELLSTLAENTRAALDRADREQVLRDRTERLERQSERLEAVATVLSEDLKNELTALADALESETVESNEWEFPFAEDEATKTLDRTERLIDDIREYARNATSVGPRALVDLETAIDDAVSTSRLESAAVVVEDGATLRADPERFRYLLETVFDDAARRSDGNVTIQIGTLGIESYATGSRGFFILDDASKNATTTETLPDFTIDGDESTDGLGLAVARAIAEAHDWSVSIGVGDRGGTRFEVRDVTTLEPV
ncbi:GAF domain-containing protein [Halovivax gelatinilyticus]|uniref:sensor histidine kinase n=1 Tax=Halovivax gelatinilyticus TaxID=2961597 RepID=UPI0020CA97A9|nr:GAF domain-containing protein [Halovivax gelatinilyticus]